MMKVKSNSEYWEKRIAENTWKHYNALEDKNRELLELYQDANKGIREELYAISEKYSKDGVLSLSEMHKQNRLTELNKKYENIVKQLGQESQKRAKKNMQSGFKEVYTNVCEGLGNPDFSMPNRALMNELLERPWFGDSFSKRIWKNQKKLATTLNDVLLNGLQQGKTVFEIASNLNNVMGQGFNAAHKLVRTETMHYLNTASIQGYKDSGCEKVQIWAAMDERTCSTCGVGGYHGKIYDIDKAPILPFHANCRCTYLPVVQNFFSQDKLSDEYFDKQDSDATISDTVYQARGMNKTIKKDIESGILKIKKEYNVSLDGIMPTNLGKKGKSTFFAAAPYETDDTELGFALVINVGYDYNGFIERIQDRYESGFFAGKSIEDYVAHEMAHIMTFQGCKTAMEYNNLKSLINTHYVPGVSGYSDITKSGTECLAEAFVRLRNGEQVPAKIRAAVKYYIERWKK